MNRRTRTRGNETRATQEPPRQCRDCGGSMFWEHPADTRCAACRQKIGAAIHAAALELQAGQ